MPVENTNMSLRSTFGKNLSTIEEILSLADIEIFSDTVGKGEILSFANRYFLDDSDIRYSAQHDSCIWRNPNTEIHASIQNQAIRAFVDYRGIRWLCHFTDRKNLPNILKNGLLPRNLLSDTAAVSDSLRFDRCSDSLCLSISLHNHWMLNKKIEQGIIDPCLILLSPRILWEKQCTFYPHNAATACYRNIPFDEMSGLYRFKAMFDPVISFQKANGTSGMWARQNHQHFCEPTSQQAEVQCLQAIEPAYILYVIERNLPSSYDELVAMIDNWPTYGQTARISAVATPSSIEAKSDAFDSNSFDVMEKNPVIGSTIQQTGLQQEDTKLPNHKADEEISVIQSIKEYMAEVKREQIEGKEARMEKFMRKLEEDARKHDQEHIAKMTELKKKFEEQKKYFETLTGEKRNSTEQFYNDMVGTTISDEIADINNQIKIIDDSISQAANQLQADVKPIKREADITQNKQKVERLDTESSNAAEGCSGLTMLILFALLYLLFKFLS